MSKILVLGSSHTAVISRACQDVPNFDCWWVKHPRKPDGNGDITTDQAIDLARGLTKDDVVAITWVGTNHNVIGLVQHDKPFDFIEPGVDEDVDAERELIPYNMLLDTFSFHTKRDTLTPAIGESTSAKVVVLAIPPVKEDDNFILSRTKMYRGLDPALQGITPARIRAKLWRLEMKTIADFCNEIGAQFLPPPRSSLNDDGYLRKEFWGKDATHANDAYGKLVVEQLQSLVSTQPA